VCLRLSTGFLNGLCAMGRRKVLLGASAASAGIYLLCFALPLCFSVPFRQHPPSRSPSVPGGPVAGADGSQVSAVRIQNNTGSLLRASLLSTIFASCAIAASTRLLRREQSRTRVQKLGVHGLEMQRTSAGQSSRVQRYAGGSFLEALSDDEAKEQADLKEQEEMQEDTFGVVEDEESDMFEEMSEEELARRGERQIVYNLYPSKQYVLYIAKKNAERKWTKDGPDGRNKGCLEVQIGILTERIRNSVLHVREFIHDYRCRVRLVSLVARRRRLMDKLALKDLDSYLKIREELKIRHVYKLEALIGRLPAYRFATRDRKQAPGRKVSMRLKKTKRLLNNRLASQLRQGKSRIVLHKTRKQITSRKWLTRAYDDVSSLVAGREPAQFIDPLKLP